MGSCWFDMVLETRMHKDRCLQTLQKQKCDMTEMTVINTYFRYFCFKNDFDFNLFDLLCPTCNGPSGGCSPLWEPLVQGKGKTRKRKQLIVVSSKTIEDKVLPMLEKAVVMVAERQNRRFHTVLTYFQPVLVLFSLLLILSVPWPIRIVTVVPCLRKNENIV